MSLYKIFARLDNFIRRCWSLWNIVTGARFIYGSWALFSIAVEVRTDARLFTFNWDIAVEVRTDVHEEIGLTMLTESNAIVLLRIASPKSAQGST